MVEPRQLIGRRALAVVLLAAGIALAVWLASLGLRTRHHPRPVTVAPPPTLRILFPEGYTRRDMAARIAAVAEIARRKRGIRPALSAQGYLAVTRSSPLPGRFAGDAKRRSLEGFLFPATYPFTSRTTSRQFVAEQLAAFRAAWANVDLRFARSKNLTRYDVLIIASLIEKEVKSPEERPLVAAVIYNRLHARVPLGIDAAIRYGLAVPPTQSLRESQLHDPTPYNTRLHRGLPPTPIANPGLASLQAAAHPAKVNYLYFVRKPDKVHHFFTASQAAFDRYLAAHGYGPGK